MAIGSLAEWMVCAEPADVLRHLGDRADERRLRMFACASTRRVAGLLTKPGLLDLLGTAEAFADGRVTKEELKIAWMAVRKALGSVPLGTKWEDALMALLHTTADAMTPLSAHLVLESVAKALDSEWRAQHPNPAQADMQRQARGNPDERRHQAGLLREIFAWEPRNVDGGWREVDQRQAVQLAEAIYREGWFAELPILADALEDVGCPHEDLIAHFLDPEAVHGRGCWALDAVIRGAIG